MTNPGDHGTHRFLVTLLAAALLALPATAQQLGNYVILVNNDLGMHCMNADHSYLSVLPPYNNLQAQVIRRGNAAVLPSIVTANLSLEYSFPGNTYSVGKTNFWTYSQDLFGVTLAPNVGLTGKTLNDGFEIDGDIFRADGIPLTPFMDAAPTVEVPFQVAQVILRDAGGVELTRAYPVAPVSVEMNCVTTGCHGSEMAILNAHEVGGGFDPANRPILCAQCHGSTPLTGPNPGSADWFSRRIHEKHQFIDEEIPGMAGCYMCHPGANVQCSRGTMATDHGMICQDCHGNLANVKNTIENGRIPWLDEPACRTCHTTTYGEPVGQLFRNSRGHGGVLCANCHNSPHADFPSREAVDNRVMVDLQGHVGVLSDCTVCHGVSPTGAGPHGIMAASAVEDEIFAASGRLKVFPSPAQAGTGCRILAASGRVAEGKLLVFDMRGRTIRLLHAEAEEGGAAVVGWDGRDSQGRDVASGIYFLRWDDGREQAAGKVVIVK
jgi:hypothetical protein